MDSPRTTTFPALWAQSVAARGEADFLHFEDAAGATTVWSYAAFDEVVARTAARFVAGGVSPERGVHLALTNSPAFVATWIAATRLGSWIVPSDPMGTARELAEHLERTRPAVGVCAASRADVYRAAVAASGVDLAVVEIDEADADPAPLLGDRALTEWPEVPPRARAAVMFTSGTTGRPKGVEITSANYAFAGESMAAASALGAGDRYLVVLPLFHANAQYYSFAAAIAVGASVALMHTFSASRFVEQAARHGATHASLFAGPIRMILARGGPLAPGFEPALTLRHCWYAQNITAEQYDTISAWLGCRPRQLYGMTETIPAVLTDDADAPRHDAMGWVTPGCVVELQADDGGPIAAGEVGEVVVGGEPGITLFAGYLDDADTTAASFRGGWFLTGDRARLGTDGRFEFDGRRKDVLKVAGENVSVVEVEAVIDSHPGVHDVVVVGAPDPVRDEVPVAFVVPTADAPATLAADLAAWCAARLGKAKRPHQIAIVDELPRTSVGKVRKFMLVDSAARMLELSPTVAPDPRTPPQPEEAPT